MSAPEHQRAAQVLRGALTSGSARALPARQPSVPQLRSEPARPSVAPAAPFIQLSEAEWTARCEQLRHETEQELREQLAAEALVRARETVRQEQVAWLEKQQQQQAQQWRALAQTLAEQFGALREQLAEQVLELSQLAAGRWLGQQWADAQQLRPLVHALLQQAGQDKPLRVLLHPLDWQHWVQTPAQGEVNGLEVLADERVRRGGCLIESPRQTLDARLETQLALLDEVFAAARQARTLAAQAEESSRG